MSNKKAPPESLGRRFFVSAKGSVRDVADRRGVAFCGFLVAPLQREAPLLSLRDIFPQGGRITVALSKRLGFARKARPGFSERRVSARRCFSSRSEARRVANATI